MDFTAIDFETANGYRGSPCAVGLVKVRGGVVVDERRWLMRPPERVDYFDGFNTSLHGITAVMVAGQPRWRARLPALIEFIGNDVVVAHNAGFDIGVIRYACAADNIEWPAMRFLCTLVLSRRALRLPSYRLPYVVESLGLSLAAYHDALADARAVVDIVTGLVALSGTDGLSALAQAHHVGVGRMSAGLYTGSVVLGSGGGRLVRSDLNPDADPDGYLYGRVVVFTGALTSMTRQIAWEECARVGALTEQATTKRTNVLVVGDINPAVLRPGSNLTGKARRAFELQDKGQDIEVMTEDDFLRCLDGKPLEGTEVFWPEGFAPNAEQTRPTAPAGTPTRLRSVPLAERAAVPTKPSRKDGPPKPLNRAPSPTEQTCSEVGCGNVAAFRTSRKPTWCLGHIAAIQRAGGLAAVEPFTHPESWQLTECLTCAVRAHYRFAYAVDKAVEGERTCRACFWRRWAVEARKVQGAWANLAPVDLDDAKATAERNGFDYLGPLTAPSLDGDPHHTRCRRCGKLAAERLGDIRFGCTCSR